MPGFLCSLQLVSIQRQPSHSRKQGKVSATWYYPGLPMAICRIREEKSLAGEKKSHRIICEGSSERVETLGEACTSLWLAARKQYIQDLRLQCPVLVCKLDSMSSHLSTIFSRKVKAAPPRQRLLRSEAALNAWRQEQENSQELRSIMVRGHALVLRPDGSCKPLCFLCAGRFDLLITSWKVWNTQCIQTVPVKIM